MYRQAASLKRLFQRDSYYSSDSSGGSSGGSSGDSYGSSCGKWASNNHDVHALQSLPENQDHLAPLYDLQLARQLMAVDILDGFHPHSYQTMIVGINVWDEMLWLDSFTPDNIYDPVKVGDNLSLSHRQHGQILNFQTTVKTITNDRYPLIGVALPEDIGYRSRRIYPRWQPEKGHSTMCRLASPIGIPWSAKIVNLSAGGARLSIAGNITSQLSRGCYFNKFHLNLNNTVRVECAAELKTARFSRRPYEHTLLSVSLRNIAVSDKIKIQNYVCYQLDSNNVTLFNH